MDYTVEVCLWHGGLAKAVITPALKCTIVTLYSAGVCIACFYPRCLQLPEWNCDLPLSIAAEAQEYLDRYDTGVLAAQRHGHNVVVQSRGNVSLATPIISPASEQSSYFHLLLFDSTDMN